MKKIERKVQEKEEDYCKVNSVTNNFLSVVTYGEKLKEAIRSNKNQVIMRMVSVATVENIQMGARKENLQTIEGEKKKKKIMAMKNYYCC